MLSIERNGHDLTVVLLPKLPIVGPVVDECLGQLEHLIAQTMSVLEQYWLVLIPRFVFFNEVIEVE